MFGLKLLLAATLSLAALSAYGVPATSSCLRVRIALDIGSGSTKMRSGVVDVCVQKLLTQIVNDPLTGKPVKFLKNLKREGSDGSFDPVFLDAAVQAISIHLKSVKDATIAALKDEPKYSDYASLATSDIEVSAIATEAFRQANNTQTFVNLMQKVNIPVHPLTQTDEGRTGFMGTMVDQAVDPTTFLSWDIGNGSLQIVGFNRTGGSGTWNDFGNRLTSDPMVNFVLGFKGVSPTTTPDGKFVSPNPILPFSQDKKALLAAADTFVRAQLADASWITSRAHSAKVFGIGGMHTNILKSVTSLANHTGATSYTAKTLGIIFDDIFHANDAYVTNKYKVDADFAYAAPTNMLLVYTVMKVLGIEEVFAIDVDNTLGTLINPRFWNPTPVSNTNIMTW